ncbi:MAG: hypothetical protein ACTHU0_12870 [Kofleriaceae bacterium]
MSEHFEELLIRLRSGTGEVEIDLPVPSPDLVESEVEDELGRLQGEAAQYGERVAYLYPVGDKERRGDATGTATLTTMVTEAESIELLSAGAVWIGPENAAPQVL